MTDQEIIEMGIQADLCDEYGTIKWEYGYRNEIIAFAKLVAEKEREWCASFIEDLDERWFKELAGLIRARGQE